MQAADEKIHAPDAEIPSETDEEDKRKMQESADRVDRFAKVGRKEVRTVTVEKDFRCPLDHLSWSLKHCGFPVLSRSY